MKPPLRNLLAVVVLTFLVLTFLSSFGSAQTGPALLQDPASKAKLDALASLAKFADEGWRFHEGDIPNGEDPQLDDRAWMPVAPNFAWTTGTAWFRRTVEIPKAFHGYDLAGAALSFQFRADSEDFTPQIIYYNGARIAMGEDLEPIVLVRSVQPGQVITIAVKAMPPPEVKTRFRGASLTVQPPASRPDPGFLREELLSVALLLEGEQASDADRQRLSTAVAAIDTAALERADQKAFDASLVAAQQALAPLAYLLRQRAIRVTGNSHIDMAWLWPWSETTTVIRDTFRTSLQLMNEYPEYTFTQSSAAASEWMEEKYPLLFRQIKKRVQEGRWEIVGGMWVEPDLNIPDGESLVRQLLLGKRYFKQKFGVDVRIGWNPDSFGYSWQLPQIYKKSGMDYFVTQKLYWNDTNKPKHKLFWWQSPDGSRVLTYLPHDYANDINPVRIATDLANYSRQTPGFDQLMHLYGVGDHGGGPTRAMIDIARRWEGDSAVYPRVFFGTAQGFFDHLDKKVASMDLPIINDELYFEYHRGVFTTQAESKRGNRESEVLILDAEKFASLAHLQGEAYEAGPLEYAWKKALFNQFHDIAAGSGISALYRDAERDYAEVANLGQLSLERSLRALAAHANTSGAGVAVIVFNPLAWERDDVAMAEVQLRRAPAGALVVMDATGRAMPTQVVASDPVTHRYTLRFLARGVPSLGYKVFHVVGGAAKAAGGVTIRGQEIENQFLKLTFDPTTGCISSLVEKKTGKETIASGGCGNLLQAFRDKPKSWDAWNIDADFEDQKWDLLEAKRVEVVERGPFRVVVRVEKSFQNSTFVQDITVYDGVPRVDVVTDADWHEKHILIKAAVPLAVHNDNATYEIPYGAIQRPTTRRTPEEKAQFEVPALRWADLSDAEHGLSLLNDCKYGYDGKDNVLRISLLRAPEWPDPHADEGRHHFTYSLYPHAGDWKQAQTMRRGYELNYKLQAMQVESHAGPLGARHSFAQVEPGNVVLTALKKAEDDDALLFRFYEWAGEKTNVKVTLPPGATTAQETNLMEAPQGPLAIVHGAVIVPTGAYEIKTVKVTFAPAKSASAKGR